MRRALERVDSYARWVLDRARRSDRERRTPLMTALLTPRPGCPHGASYGAVRDEALGLLIACQDTTPAALAGAHHLLTRHATAYDALAAEVDEVCGGRAPSVDDAPRLHLARGVFQERQTAPIAPQSWSSGASGNSRPVLTETMRLYSVTSLARSSAPSCVMESAARNVKRWPG